MDAVASSKHAASAEEPGGGRRLDGRARCHALGLAQDAGHKERDTDEEHVLGAAVGFQFTGGFYFAGAC